MVYTSTYMVAARLAYSKWQIFVRGISATFAIVFGFFALFFTPTSKIWDSAGSNHAHAEAVGVNNDSGCGDCCGGSGGCGDGCNGDGW